MASNTRNVKLGVCRIYFRGLDLGYTIGGVEVTAKTDTHKVSVDQFGKSTINEVIMSRDVMAKIPLAETTIENMVATMPGAVMSSTGGSVATGTVTVTTNPGAGDTIVINGKTITFVSAATGLDGQVLIGGSAAATAVNLSAYLDSSNDPLVAQAVYTVAGAVVSVKWGNPLIGGTAGVKALEGNGFTLATGTAGAKVTVSGATLTGGTDVTSKFVTVQNGIGIDLLSIAGELRLHPIANAANDVSDDFVIPVAATAGSLSFAYKLEDERVYNVEFNGYPNPLTSTLFTVGV